MPEISKHTAHLEPRKDIVEHVDVAQNDLLLNILGRVLQELAAPDFACKEDAEVDV